MSKLGALLESERAARDLTLTDFARDVLDIDHSLVSRYVNGHQSPSRQNARKIADALARPRTEIDALIEADGGGQRRRPAAGDAATRDLIRLTVLETIEQMDRRRDRVPADDPEVAAMVAEINAELARMTLPQIEEARRCFREELRRHRRAEGQRLQS
jgi:transcriptional regulator with XRE-family HTH domain